MSSFSKQIYDIAKGLHYLHGVSILHGGLQGSNVLIDKSGSAVLSGFSLSKEMEPDASCTLSNPSGAYRWMAPEAQSTTTMNPQTDVWSWGMTALEIISGRECPALLSRLTFA